MPDAPKTRSGSRRSGGASRPNLGTGASTRRSPFSRRIEQLWCSDAAGAGRPARQRQRLLPDHLPPLYLDILRQLSRWIDIRGLYPQPLPRVLVRRRRPEAPELPRHASRTVITRLATLCSPPGENRRRRTSSLLFADEGSITEEDSVFLPAGGEHLLARTTERDPRSRGTRTRQHRTGERRPQHRSACLPFADARAGGAAGPVAGAVRRRRPADAGADRRAAARPARCGAADRRGVRHGAGAAPDSLHHHRPAADPRQSDRPRPR
jgi:hypothetical protein